MDRGVSDEVFDEFRDEPRPFEQDDQVIRGSRGECSRMTRDAALRRIHRSLLLPPGEPGVTPTSAPPDEIQNPGRVRHAAGARVVDLVLSTSDVRVNGGVSLLL